MHYVYISLCLNSVCSVGGGGKVEPAEEGGSEVFTGQVT